jgi:DNA-binding IclR family transcriptional regulator
VSRFRAALATPDPDSAEGRRRALFLRELITGPATCAELHTVTGLAPGSIHCTSRILSELHAEGLVARRRASTGYARAWLYRLP